MALVQFCSACGSRLRAAPPTVCPACGASHWLNPKPCAGDLVMHEGRLLLLRRAKPPHQGAWDIPGGFCNVGEHPEATAVREMLEETGLAVRVTGLLGIWPDRYGEGDVADHTLNLYYHAELLPDVPAVPPSDPEETLEAGWFEPDRLPADIAFPDHERQVLAAWRASVAPQRGRSTA